MKTLRTIAVAAAVLAGATSAWAQSSRTMPTETASTVDQAVAITTRQVTQARTACDAGDQAACQRGAEVTALRQRMYGLFERCAGGEAVACTEHDAEAARIVQAGEGGSTGEAETGEAQTAEAAEPDAAAETTGDKAG